MYIKLYMYRFFFILIFFLCLFAFCFVLLHGGQLLGEKWETIAQAEASVAVISVQWHFGFVHVGKTWERERKRKRKRGRLLRCSLGFRTRLSPPQECAAQTRVRRPASRPPSVEGWGRSRGHQTHLALSGSTSHRFLPLEEWIRDCCCFTGNDYLSVEHFFF